MIFYEEILREFQTNNVKYVLVDGLAVNLLGSMRSTADMDILVEMSNENLKKIIDILTVLGYEVKQPVDPMKLADEKTREEWITKKHMKAFNFYKDDELKEVDIIIKSPVSFEEASRNALSFKIDDILLSVISLDDLIKMKKNTGRAIDRQDIRELKKIRKLRSNL
ncbi:MAG: hypothetical protein KAT47_02050 [Candidatus Aegiribacteria sp.]|nr:hypothetical protein [Candidatus Aegiribacteria sp.]